MAELSKIMGVSVDNITKYSGIDATSVESVMRATWSHIPEVGVAMEGGYFAGQVMDGGTKYNLIICPKASGLGINYHSALGSVIGTSQIDGPSNTAIQVAAGGVATSNFAAALTTGGYTDWYHPSRMELNTVIYTLKPNSGSFGYTSVGANPYAVAPQPINTNWASGAPAQTSATIFQTGGSEELDSGPHQSSTERNTNYVYGWSPTTGNNYINVYKGNTKKARAIRRVVA
jgi:hypothetical protein